MSESYPEEFERKSTAELKQAIQDIHQGYLESVPNYSPGVWNPYEAIRYKGGGCTSELLYVAGGLLAGGLIQESDISIGFSKTHGTLMETGLVSGNKSQKVAHTTMFITAPDGLLAADFRAFSVSDIGIRKVDSDDLPDVDEYYIGPLTDAIGEYVTVLGQEPLSVDDLVGLHNDGDSGGAPGAMGFDEDF